MVEDELRNFPIEILTRLPGAFTPNIIIHTPQIFSSVSRAMTAFATNTDLNFNPPSSSKKGVLVPWK